MKNILESISNNKVYYSFQCDDKRKSLAVPTDDSFSLTEIEKLNKLLNICNENRLQYTLFIELWNDQQQQITKIIYLVDSNYKNY